MPDPFTCVTAAGAVIQMMIFLIKTTELLTNEKLRSLMKPIKMMEWKERVAKYKNEEYYNGMDALGYVEAITKLKRIENTILILSKLLVNKRATRPRRIWRWVSTPLRVRDIRYYGKELDDRLDKLEAHVRNSREHEPSIPIRFDDAPSGDSVLGPHEYLGKYFPPTPTPILSI